ncbi:MAG: amidohydrolase family protein [Chitinophagales bacterium]|nr:amidohydrolase family protein [Chitinophagales bacterium]MDW8428090.1 amidohydrolase family protein [Chitinophagales bacterium]
MKKIRILVFGLMCVQPVAAQRIAPAPAQTAPVVLVGATLHVGNGRVIAPSVVRFDKGVITYAGPAADYRQSNQGAQVIDVTGKHIYPGLIAANTQLGLNEIELVRATHDYAEVGDFNACVRSLVAYNTDSRIIPTIRNNGILLAQIVPMGGRIAGTSSVVQLDAWNWEDAAYQADNGIHLYWPSYFRYRWTSMGAEVGPDSLYERNVQRIKDFFQEAFSYLNKPAPEVPNLNFEAVRGLREGRQKLFIHCNYVREIIHAVQWALDASIRPVIVGGRDAHLCTDLLRQHNIPVLLLDAHSLPPYPDSDIELPYKTAALLREAGVTYGLTTSGFWQVRNLPFMAGTTVAYGVPYEDAVASVTWSVAKILGIDDRTGTVEPGKDANLLVVSGDLLDMRTSQVEAAYIQGRAISLDDAQRQLYRIFKEKYGLR